MVFELMPYIWAGVGLALIAAEFAIPGFVIFFFGAGGLITAALTALVPGLRGNVPLQVLLWLASSAASLFALRRTLRNVFSGREDAGLEEEAFSGRRATVVEQISPQRPGRVRFQGTTWEAVSYDGSFAPGQSVQIIKNENLTLVVARSFTDELLDDDAKPAVDDAAAPDDPE